MPVKWRACDVRGWRPETREGATLTTIAVQKFGVGTDEERVYLFGGLSRGLHSTVAYLVFDNIKSMELNSFRYRSVHMESTGRGR